MNSKKENLNNLFISIFFTTLMFADVTAQLHTEALQIIYYFIGYFLAFALIDKRLKTQDYLSEQKMASEHAKDKINVSGIIIETEAEADVEENRFFRIIEQKSMINRKLFILLYTILIFFTFKAAPENFHIYSMIPFITAILIVLSATIGHLLIPLFFNALYFTLRTKETSAVFIVSYIALFLLTLIVYSLAFKDKLKPSVINYHALTRNLLSGFVPLLFLISTIHYFTKKPIDFLSYNKVNKINHKAGELLNKAPALNIKLPQLFDPLEGPELKLDMSKQSSGSKKENLSKSLSKLDLDKLPNMNIKIDLRDSKQSKNLNNQIEKTQELVNQLDQSTNVNPADIEKLKSQLKNIKIDLQISEDSKNPAVDGNSEKLTIEGQKNLLNNLESAVNKLQENPLGNKDSIANLKEDLNKLSKSTQAHQQSQLPKAAVETAPPTAPISTVARPLPPPKKIPPLINESLLKALLEMLKTLVIAAMVIGVLIFLNKFFKKTEYKDLKRVKADPEAESMLKNELNTLKKLKLSPRDEIILYYELIYKIIKFYHFPDHEAPPPTETYHQIVNKHLSIQKQLYAVDEIFCRSFYGNHPVTNEQLTLFRKSIPSILIRFGLKKRLFR